MTHQPSQPPHRNGRPAELPPPRTAPALRQPRWSGKKTAVAAALAIGLSSAGAITASAAVPSGTGAGHGVGGPGRINSFRQLGENGAGGFGNPRGGSGTNSPGAVPSGAPGAGDAGNSGNNP